MLQLLADVHVTCFKFRNKRFVYWNAENVRSTALLRASAEPSSIHQSSILRGAGENEDTSRPSTIRLDWRGSGAFLSETNWYILLPLLEGYVFGAVATSQTDLKFTSKNLRCSSNHLSGRNGPFHGVDRPQWQPGRSVKITFERRYRVRGERKVCVWGGFSIVIPSRIGRCGSREDVLQETVIGDADLSVSDADRERVAHG
ncbi:hypothetical protein Bbelb_397460 [Branchiostoma belcheri]|nr:hypothetical protein Bbelb_397460 [Branchiostoma belcheri]